MKTSCQSRRFFRSLRPNRTRLKVKPADGEDLVMDDNGENCKNDQSTPRLARQRVTGCRLHRNVCVCGSGTRDSKLDNVCLDKMTDISWTLTN